MRFSGLVVRPGDETRRRRSRRLRRGPGSARAGEHSDAYASLYVCAYVRV